MEQGLGDGEHHLFRREVGLLLPHQIGRMTDAVVGDVVGVGETAAPIFGRGRHDPVIGQQPLEQLRQRGLGEKKRHK